MSTTHDLRAMKRDLTGIKDGSDWGDFYEKYFSTVENLIDFAIDNVEEFEGYR